MIVSGSIVVYNEKEEVLKRAIDSFLSLDLEKELVVVDNSCYDKLREFCSSFDNVKYIHCSKNIGFGSGHNLAFKSLKKKSDIHVVINPDVFFEKEIEEYIKWMNANESVSLSVPKVYFPSGVYQHTVREIPRITTFFKRKINIRTDEFAESDMDEIQEIPFAHGCFLMFRTDVYKKLCGFDERFFMYMEDVDIFIRAKELGSTVINPEYKIYHEHRKGSSKSRKLFLLHLESIVKFFLKYPKQIF